MTQNCACQEYDRRLPCQSTVPTESTERGSELGHTQFTTGASPEIPNLNYLRTDSEVDLHSDMGTAATVKYATDRLLTYVGRNTKLIGDYCIAIHQFRHQD